MQNAECKTPQSASLTAPLSGRAAAELWDLRSAILSDLVGADIKSDTTDIIHSQRKALKMQKAKCRVQNKPLSSSAMPKPLSPKGDSYQNAEFTPSVKIAIRF